ncbi:diguanylate cyclase [Salipiger aestuarii]|uniref:Diguanylate cyclase (GGDEF)-like protein n=1 Tax=Salipiger aestuarii TaxID=568098 RepID=A0A327XND4_9RHOB|nr:bifunctional diguanylate cyclase/phosphodiesterase [Salipiger aestuarii]KAB2538450.1 diguanylate cyclase [Salipiger aestuarii]RAK09446.1 diguanylate cyclase (GGDEF)-like protein [Salipiger aestuarii]
MKLALNVTPSPRAPRPAALAFTDEVDQILGFLLSPGTEALYFFAAPSYRLPEIAPVSRARDAGMSPALLAWVERCVAGKSWDNIHAHARQSDDPLAADLQNGQRLTLGCVTSDTGELYGMLASRQKLAQLADPADASDLTGARGLLAHSISRWRDLKLLELDCADEMQRSERLARQAQLDGLTLLLNQNAYRMHCADLLAGDAANHAVIMIDVDNFKAVNDIYGHHFGDVYLREVARAISRALPRDALIGRIGGDEFSAMIPLPPDGRPYVDRLMTSCVSDVQRAAARIGKPNLGRISIGCATCSECGRDVDTMMQCADAALYACKNAGHGSAVIFDPLRHESLSALLIKPRFLAALHNNEIKPYFQPVVDLASGGIRGFEVLLRWIHPQKGVLGPSEFASIVSDPEMAETLTRHVVDGALTQFSRRSSYRHETLALNLGTVDLIKAEFVFDLQAQLAAFDIGWHQIVIEVTENTMLGAINGPVFQNLKEMRSRGAKVALDDFGTGYGGLAHLRDWPVDIIKLDRSYVHHASRSDEDAIFARALIDIARTLGLEVIAEGVETPETAALLCALGCRMAQGYLFAAPGPIETFEEVSGLPGRAAPGQARRPLGEGCEWRWPEAED